jgi:hypothetical protein
MRRKVRRTTNATLVRVVLDIKPRLVSPAQKQAWKRFWQCMVAGTKSEAENG